MRKKTNLYFGLLLCFVIAAAFIVSKSFLQVVMIDGDSMYPTYHNHEMVLIKKNNIEVVCGDVIVFYAEDFKCLLCKRIAGIPGDTITFNDDSGISSISLGTDEYFVLGDNRDESVDSRSKKVGTVKSSQIIGKVIVPQREFKQ